MRNRTEPQPDHDVLIIGTGFAGLCMAIQLRKAGMSNFSMVEKEEDVGGTWLVNTYPGCACDVQSHMYSFSFEPNADWSREFSPQPEILAYLRRCADKYQLRPQVRFGTQVVGAEYDEPASMWRLKLAKAADVKRYMEAKGLKPGDALPLDQPDAPHVQIVTARVVVAGMGGLSIPAYPALPGVERFEGEAFHSQQWNHAYDLRGKRVAVIGTGASAIQFVPAIQPEVGHIDLYQRTPPWIMPKSDRAITVAERWAMKKAPALRWARRASLYTQLESRAIAFVVSPKLLVFPEAVAKLLLRKQVKNPELRKKVTPDYRIGCKRILLSNDWYPAISQPNVDVVTHGIREVTKNSIIDTQGVERPVDAIIYGTGFRVSDLVPRGVIFGRGGVDVVDTWTGVPEAYKGITIAGCPNLFLLMGPNTALGHNSVVYMIECQVAYAMSALRTMREQNLIEVDIKPTVQSEFNSEIQQRSDNTVWKQGGCKSWYVDPATGRNIAAWPGFTFTYRWATRTFDTSNYVTKKAQVDAS